MKTSWYKEPWAWLVFILPGISIISGTSILIIANTNPDSLVVGDYYKEGKAINRKLEKVRLAQKLGMKFGLKMSNKELIIKPEGIEKTFPLLNVSFYHPTQEEKDFQLSLTPDGNGSFRQRFDEDIKGKWRVTLTSFENTWQIQNTIYLPQSEFIDIVPKLNEAN